MKPKEDSPCGPILRDTFGGGDSKNEGCRNGQVSLVFWVLRVCRLARQRREAVDAADREWSEVDVKFIIDDIPLTR